MENDVKCIMTVLLSTSLPMYFSLFSGEILGFETVVFHVFDFIHALVESSKFKAVVKTHLEQLLYFLLVYMEITEDQVRTLLV